MASTNFKVKNGLDISGTLVVSNGVGSNGQVLSSTGTGVQWVNASSGSGDVVGPASSTDNAVVRFDGTTGKLIQNSTAASIDDSGNADFLSTKSDYFDIDTTATTTTFAAGRTLWNAANKTASLCFDSGSVQADLGQSIYAYVTNADSTTINLGDAVYIFGATGNRASVKKASSSSESTSSKTLGLAAQSIAANATGMVITQGTLGGLSLGSYTAGDTVYLGTTAGTITNVKPSAPTNLVVIGVVERANNGNGQILVKVQNGFELSELHDVSINGTLASGNTLIYDATALLWKNASLTAGTGISVTNGAASITIANTGVTSVSGTSPVVSSGGTTPAISMPVATTSVNGYLSSTDWTTFNNKGSGTVTSIGSTTLTTGGTSAVPTVNLTSGIVTAGTTGSASLIPVVTVDTYGRVTTITTAANPQGTVTSVTGTSPVVSSGGATPAISMPAATTSVNGYLTSTDWTTFNNKGSGSVTSVTGGTYLTGGTITTTGTLAVDATSANTASKVVARDASGNFSAGTITASLTGNASGSSGSCTGNSATATTATNLSGGSVAATTGTFSGTVTIKSGSALGKLTVQTGGSDPVSPAAGDMVWYY